MPPNTVSVARPTKWGNPFRVGMRMCDLRIMYAGQCVPGYTHHLPSTFRIDNQIAACAFKFFIAFTPEGHELLAAARRELAGKNLACWCRLDNYCHADTWLDAVNTERR